MSKLLLLLASTGRCIDKHIWPVVTQHIPDMAYIKTLMSVRGIRATIQLLVAGTLTQLLPSTTTVGFCPCPASCNSSSWDHHSH